MGTNSATCKNIIRSLLSLPFIIRPSGQGLLGCSKFPVVRIPSQPTRDIRDPTWVKKRLLYSAQKHEKKNENFLYPVNHLVRDGLLIPLPKLYTVIPSLFQHDQSMCDGEILVPRRTRKRVTGNVGILCV